jgi:hypothetical protein
LAELYWASRLFVYFFRPSFKLAEKHHDGAHVCKRYHAPATPYQRLLDGAGTTDETRTRVRVIFDELDPVRLLRDIRVAQERLVALADAVCSTAISEEAAAPPLDAFVSSLQTLWQHGDARPTASDRSVPKRGRRRPDPLVAVTEQMKRWFEDEPWRSGREPLGKLQTEQPGDYPDRLIRVVQRRLKIWRSEYAHALVSTHFSSSAGGPPGTGLTMSES